MSPPRVSVSRNGIDETGVDEGDRRMRRHGPPLITGRRRERKGRVATPHAARSAAAP